MKKITTIALAGFLACGAGYAEKPNKPTQTMTPPSSAINLNTADASTLSHSFKGIGLKRAESIIRYREAHHGFQSVNDLGKVSGIGLNFVNKHLAELQKTFTVK